MADDDNADFKVPDQEVYAPDAPGNDPDSQRRNAKTVAAAQVHNPSEDDTDEKTDDKTDDKTEDDKPSGKEKAAAARAASTSRTAAPQGRSASAKTSE